jgi:cyanophycinase-like exopeptidase
MQHPVGKVEIASAFEPGLRDQLNSATGIFFTGGDQLKHMKVIRELKLSVTVFEKNEKIDLTKFPGF